MNQKTITLGSIFKFFFMESKFKNNLATTLTVMSILLTLAVVLILLGTFGYTLFVVLPGLLGKSVYTVYTVALIVLPLFWSLVYNQRKYNELKRNKAMQMKGIEE